MPILVGLAVVVALAALYVHSRPAAFRITRSRVVGGSPEAVFALVEDFRAWVKWSPWERLDPAMKKTFGGAERGEGATYHWEGPKSGEGSMTITGSEAGRKLVIDLRFLKPFPANNVTTFTFEPEGEGTRVTWTMEGQNGFLSKAFDAVMNMDKTVGRDFESGLEAMAGAVSR